jgi:hypothetical protein
MDKSKLLANRVPEGTVDIPGVGTITVRGLSRQEMKDLEEWQGKDHMVWERKTLALCMVDPPMTEGDIAAWQAGSPATEINDVAMKVNELSGISKNASKEAYKSDGDDPGA